MLLNHYDLKAAVFNRRMLICIFTGFSSGLPLFVIIQLLQIWLRDHGVGLKEIGLFSLAGLPYVLKFLWAPIVDLYVPPLFGRRRGWMLLFQFACMVGIVFLGTLNPAVALSTIAIVVLLVAFFSASQDVVLDAFRREILPDHELGLGNSVHVQAYRLAGLIPGSLALILADYLPWSVVFWVVGAFMLLGILMCLFAPEPELEAGSPVTIKEAVVEPFQEFFRRKGWRHACLVLLFMLLYKLGDSMATALSSAFYLDLGFTKTEIGLVAKHAALWPSIIGGLLGGLLMVKVGINRALWLFGVVQLTSILGFALLVKVGANLWVLAAVIGYEYLGVGLGTAAFIAYIARETDRRYAATQFALLTAITALPRTFANASTGYIVEFTGWAGFFYLCALIAVPGMLLLMWVAPWRQSVNELLEGSVNSKT